MELDAVGIRSDPPTAVFTEVKRTSKPVGREVLNSLISKAFHFGWKRGRRREIRDILEVRVLLHNG